LAIAWAARSEIGAVPESALGKDFGNGAGEEPSLLVAEGFFTSPMFGKSIGPWGSEYSGKIVRKRGWAL
jgi:hypothetical protein